MVPVGNAATTHWVISVDPMARTDVLEISNLFCFGPNHRLIPGNPTTSSLYRRENWLAV
jgi:hypothetical protein